MKNTVWSLSAILFLWVIWLIAYAFVKNDYILPSFAESLKEAGRLLTEGSFWRAFSATLSRTLSAFAVSFVLALLFSVVAYMVPPFGRFFAPIVSAVRSLPAMAVILIVLVWTTPKTAPVIVAFLALFPLLYTGMYAALGGVDPELAEMSRVYRVPVWKRIAKLYLPSAAPYVLKESAAALSFSLKLVVSAEVLANTYRSVGGLMQQAKMFVEMPTLFALTLVVLVAGFLLEGIGMLAARAAARGAGWN